MVDPMVFQIAGESLSVSHIEETQPDVESTEIEFDLLALVATSVAEGKPLALQGAVRGKRIRYIYLDLMLQNKKSGLLVGPVGREFFRAEKELEVGGVKVPDWGQEIKLAQKVEPKIRILRDGKNAALGALQPQIYGLGQAQMHYAASGQLLSKESKDGSDGMATFASDGQFENLASQRGSGSVQLKKGDQFRPYLQVFQGFEKGLGDVGSAVSNGLDAATMFFEELPLQVGQYALGVSVQTWDGDWAHRFIGFKVI